MKHCMAPYCGVLAHWYIVLAEWDRKANTTPLSRLMICDGLEYTGSNVIKNLPYWKYTQAIVVLNLTESNQWNCCSSLRVSWMLAQVHACTCMQTYMYTYMYTIQLTCSQGSKLKRVEYYTRIHASPKCHDGYLRFSWEGPYLYLTSLPIHATEWFLLIHRINTVQTLVGFHNYAKWVAKLVHTIEAGLHIHVSTWNTMYFAQSKQIMELTKSAENIHVQYYCCHYKPQIQICIWSVIW